MKKILKAFAVIICMVLCTYAYTQTLTVKFTGRDQTGQHYVKLDHVKTFNLDQLWEEVLYFPDTTLVLGGVGIIDYGNSSNSLLEQNVPNPFNGTTHFTLYLREGADALLEVFDLMGKIVISQYYANLSAGAHLFSANLTNPQVYILKVTVKNEQMHLKMVNEGFGAENSINYVNVAAQSNDFGSEAKNGQAMGIYPFHNGDELQHTGYTVINGIEYKSETITQRQNESETLILPFNLTPTVLTDEVRNITSSSAVCGGSVSYTGEAMIVNKGICWSTAIGPTINENHTSVGAGIGDFTSIMTNLNPGTTYYVRAYATSSASITGYGEQVTFNTLATIPSVTTSVVSNITDNFATCGGNVTSDGGATVTARGICWSTNQNPTIGDNHTTDGSGTGAFTSSITSLVPNTTYYVRAYATNSEGTSYGEQKTFTTIIIPPTVITQNISNITSTTATCNGNVTSTGGATVTARGFCWSTSSFPTTNNNHTNNGQGAGNYTSDLTGLTPGTIYYVRAYATNSAGTAYGGNILFSTLANTPSVTTSAVGNITDNSATCGGNVTNDGGSTVTARGVCWSTSQNPTINDAHTSNGTGTGSFSCSITGLTHGTTYYVRAYATNSAGTAYGNQLYFTTTVSDGQPCYNVPTVTDYDGNTYNTVKIGNQCWMKENLRTTHYTNGIKISRSNSGSYVTAYYQYPNNNYSNINTYGLLYNWSAVMNESNSNNNNPSGIQGICPIGWHVPSDAEWRQLANYVRSKNDYFCGNDSANIANALASTIGWESYPYGCFPGNNPSTNNATGFSAMPAGYYGFDNFGFWAYFWSTTQTSDTYAHSFILKYDDTDVYHYTYNKQHGFSIRCVRGEGQSINPPVLTTNIISNITTSSSICGGSISYDGGTPVTSHGVCWSSTPNPTINNNHTINGSGVGNYTSIITGLTPNTTYFVRAYATNIGGTSYGNEVSFTTLEDNTYQPCSGNETITDFDGNTYNTVMIGNQCWMKENLRTTHYANGQGITLINSNYNSSSPAFYMPNSGNVTIYGYLYNWHAIMHGASSSNANPSGIQGICPNGWHIPSLGEWFQLDDYVKSQIQFRCNNNDDKIAKALASTIGWVSSTTTCDAGNIPSTNNATGFSALPTGSYNNGSNNYGFSTFFWSSSESGEEGAFYYGLSYNDGETRYSLTFKSYGNPVRCLRD